MRLYSNCSRVQPVGRDFKVAFIRLDGMGHKMPSAFWFDAALGFWTHLRGPGVQDAEKESQRRNRYGKQGHPLPTTCDKNHSPYFLIVGGLYSELLLALK
jgi:hypothetical protein